MLFVVGFNNSAKLPLVWQNAKLEDRTLICYDFYDKAVMMNIFLGLKVILGNCAWLSLTDINVKSINKKLFYLFRSIISKS